MEPVPTTNSPYRILKWAQRRRAVVLFVAVLIGIAVWELVVRFSRFPAFILPPPAMVGQRLLEALLDGSLQRHAWITLSEVLVGLALGVSTATITGYILARQPALEQLLSPLIVASQSVPTVAIAPLLVIWFGSGLLSKVLISALIVFFPILVNTILGLRSVPDDLHDLMRTLNASRWQTFRMLEAPAALPVFLGGLRIGATLAVIGAVVGEFVGSDRGLGFLINRARGQFDTALVFVAILALVALALGLYGCVVLLEMQFLGWQEKPKN